MYMIASGIDNLFFGLAMVIVSYLIWRDSRGIVPGAVSWIVSLMLFFLSTLGTMFPGSLFILSLAAFASFLSWWFLVDGFLRYYDIDIFVNPLFFIPFSMLYALLDLAVMLWAVDWRFIVVNAFFPISFVLVAVKAIRLRGSPSRRVMLIALCIPAISALNCLVRLAQAVAFYGSDYWFNRGDGARLFQTALFVQLVAFGLLQLRLVNRYMVRRMQEMNDEFFRSHKGILMDLISYSDNNSDEAVNHVTRVGLLSERLALALDWNPSRAEILRDAARFHDIGKITIPDTILGKSGSLDEAEYAAVKEHSRRGHELLSHYDIPLLRMAAKIALQHHENWDGSGYPSGLRRYSIAEESRIVAICDSLDALSRKRCYKEAWADTEIVDYLRKERGRRFDPDLVDIVIGERMWEI